MLLPFVSEESMVGRALFPAVALILSLSACASPSAQGSLHEYWGVAYTNVSTRCGGGYQVYRKPGTSRILVRAYELSEARQSFCERYNGIQPSVGVTGVRHEEAVVEYMATRADLRECRLVSGTEITSLHSEFMIACPVAPTGAVRAKG